MSVAQTRSGQAFDSVESHLFALERISAILAASCLSSQARSRLGSREGTSAAGRRGVVAVHNLRLIGEPRDVFGVDVEVAATGS